MLGQPIEESSVRNILSHVKGIKNPNTQKSVVVILKKMYPDQQEYQTLFRKAFECDLDFILALDFRLGLDFDFALQLRNLRIARAQLRLQLRNLGAQRHHLLLLLVHLLLGQKREV